MVAYNAQHVPKILDHGDVRQWVLVFDHDQQWFMTIYDNRSLLILPVLIDV